MELSPKQAGFAPGRLDRIADHLSRAYIDNGKIAGCQVAVTRHGHLAYFKSLGQMDRERGKPMARRHHLPHLFDDQADHLGGADDALRARLLPAQRSGASLRAGVARPARLGVGRRRRRWRPRGPNRPVSMRDMLCHTGGLTYGAALAALGAPDSGHPVDKEYARSRRAPRRRRGPARLHGQARPSVPLRYQPGERWMYSLSTDVCGALVEIISGKRFDKYPAGRDLRAAEDEGHRLLRAAARSSTASPPTIAAAPDKKLQLIDDPAEEHVPEGADLLLRRRRPHRHHGGLCALLRDAAARRRARRRAHPRARAPSS